MPSSMDEPLQEKSGRSRQELEKRSIVDNRDPLGCLQGYKPCTSIHATAELEQPDRGVNHRDLHCHRFDKTMSDQTPQRLRTVTW